MRSARRFSEELQRSPGIDAHVDAIGAEVLGGAAAQSRDSQVDTHVDAVGAEVLGGAAAQSRESQAA